MQSWTFGAGLTMLAADQRPVILSSSALVWPLAAEAWRSAPSARRTRRVDFWADENFVGPAAIVNAQGMAVLRNAAEFAPGDVQIQQNLRNLAPSTTGCGASAVVVFAVLAGTVMLV